MVYIVYDLEYTVDGVYSTLYMRVSNKQGPQYRPQIPNSRGLVIRTLTKRRPNLSNLPYLTYTWTAKNM